MTLALVLGAALALACVLFVARPFLLDPEAKDDELDEPTAHERQRLEFLERRDRALAALKELEFDHRSGKISDEDYRSLVGGLRRQAADALRSLEPAERSLMRNLEPPSQPDIPEPYPPPGDSIRRRIPTSRSRTRRRAKPIRPRRRRSRSPTPAPSRTCSAPTVLANR